MSPRSPSSSTHSISPPASLLPTPSSTIRRGQHNKNKRSFDFTSPDSSDEDDSIDSASASPTTRKSKQGAFPLGLFKLPSKILDFDGRVEEGEDSDFNNTGAIHLKFGKMGLSASSSVSSSLSSSSGFSGDEEEVTYGSMPQKKRKLFGEETPKASSNVSHKLKTDGTGFLNIRRDPDEMFDIDMDLQTPSTVDGDSQDECPVNFFQQRSLPLFSSPPASVSRSQVSPIRAVNTNLPVLAFVPPSPLPPSPATVQRRRCNPNLTISLPKRKDYQSPETIVSHQSDAYTITIPTRTNGDNNTQSFSDVIQAGENPHTPVDRIISVPSAPPEIIQRPANAQARRPHNRPPAAPGTVRRNPNLTVKVATGNATICNGLLSAPLSAGSSWCSGSSQLSPYSSPTGFELGFSGRDAMRRIVTDGVLTPVDGNGDTPFPLNSPFKFEFSGDDGARTPGDFDEAEKGYFGKKNVARLTRRSSLAPC